MPKQKKENKLTPKEQFERFKEAAREHELDESGKPLEDAFKKVTRDKQKTR